MAKLSGTYSVNFNREQVLKICEGLDLEPEEIPKTMKAVMMAMGSGSIKFNQVVETVKKEKKTIDDYTITELEQDAKKMDINEIKRLLKGVDKKNMSNNQIDSKGLHGLRNIESYSTKFFTTWNRDLDMIPEFLVRVGNMFKEEVLMREYCRRVNVL